MVQYLDISGQLNSIKLISPVSFYFNVTARNFKIVYVLCISVLDSASSAPCKIRNSGPGKWEMMELYNGTLYKHNVNALLDVDVN